MDGGDDGGSVFCIFARALWRAMQEWHSFSNFGPRSHRLETELRLLQEETGLKLNQRLDDLSVRRSNGANPDT
jgi:hypothetical protein